MVLKYEFSTSNVSSHVVPHFDVDTSGGHHVSWVCEFVEGIEVAPSLLFAST